MDFETIYNSIDVIDTCLNCCNNVFLFNNATFVYVLIGFDKCKLLYVLISISLCPYYCTIVLYALALLTHHYSFVYC